MKNRISRISPERKQELKELIEEIRQESYQQGYEDGKSFAAEEAVKRVGLARKPANQQRAELIAKAKGIVKDTELKIWGGILVTLPNNEVKICHAEFIKKGNRTTCLLRGQQTNTVFAVGRAICMPGDVFNERIGEVISLLKALKEDIPVEFLEAVQPQNVVVGMKIQMANGKSLLLTEPKPKPLFRTEKIIDDTNAEYLS